MTRLERLRNDALDLAKTRLPSIVARLRAGESVDVNAELPNLDHGQDEIGQVAEAFNSAQLTAVSAAVSEANARNGVHNVFLGIAHRNQGVIHRQLQILDEMESREENPTQLKGLFDLDHLATRARRTTENLIILGGKQPGRRWRNPVPLMDVIRSAVGETEQYPRVQVEQVPEVAVIGSAVADTAHLIAELVDNATSFSPPGFQVHVTSTKVARGVVVDVADQGLGMKDDVREWANAMMVKPPEFDAMALKADTRLGLFVVARLSARLGMNVVFDSSRYGGTRATVLIPTELLSSDGQFVPEADSDFQNSSRETPAKESPGRSENGAWPTASGLGLLERDRATGDNLSKSTETATVMSSDTGTSREIQRSRPSTAESRAGDAPQQQAGAAAGPGRAPLPQRQPQQNIVDHLRDDPELDAGEVDQFAERTVSTISAFQRGTRRGRHSNESTES
jgi:hypothetical protein